MGGVGVSASGSRCSHRPHQHHSQQQQRPLLVPELTQQPAEATTPAQQHCDAREPEEEETKIGHSAAIGVEGDGEPRAKAVRVIGTLIKPIAAALMDAVHGDGNGHCLSSGIAHTDHTDIILRCLCARVVLNVEGVQRDGEREVGQALVIAEELRLDPPLPQVQHTTLVRERREQPTRQNQQHTEMQHEHRHALVQTRAPQLPQRSSRHSPPQQFEPQCAIDGLMYECRAATVLNKSGNAEDGSGEQEQDER